MVVQRRSFNWFLRSIGVRDACWLAESEDITRVAQGHDAFHVADLAGLALWTTYVQAWMIFPNCVSADLGAAAICAAFRVSIAVAVVCTLRPRAVLIVEDDWETKVVKSHISYFSVL